MDAQIKIAVIIAAKFDISKYDPIIQDSFTSISHRSTPYKRLIAMDHYIDGYPFDYVFPAMSEYEAWLVYVPATISKLQCVKRLLDTGRYTDLMTTIDSDPTGESRILFDAASTLARDSNMVSQFAAALGFTDEDTDEFFVEADKIMV